MTECNVRSIQCTSCAAPLTLHGGGHKIRSLTCEYCGAIMDMRQEYALLGRVNPDEKPYSPLEIGMQARFKNADFTIIGMIGWQAEGSMWIDYMLFSPTHGYAWISWNQGHFLFSRKVRILPSTNNIWQLQAKSEFNVAGEPFKFFEAYHASIYYVAGELNWIAKVGDTNEQAEAVAPPKLYAVERGEHEIEYHLGEYIPVKDIETAFKLNQSLGKPMGVHPAQPYKKNLLDSLSRAAWPFAILAVVVALAIGFMFSGKTVLEEYFTAEEYLAGKATKSFVVSEPERLVKLELASTLNNAWAWFDVSVRAEPDPESSTSEQANTDTDDNIIFSFGKEISYYSGRDSDGDWTEGSQNASAQFLVPKAGRYSLELEASEASFKRQGSTRIAPSVGSEVGALGVKVKQGYVDNKYFWWLAALSLIATGLGLFRKRSFESKRWAPTHDYDDDD